ncbi:MAG: F0F1 ATP synthase epsilon subunit [Candidatus Brocadia fulgida]|uniref:F0F1 ATP synthase epsilon subunit n=1 Tax=Candidatus Brocadia fulgida TaxID=380242 RepID=A0A0M2UQU2_9BACT|nr:MAG: F0F1 ATP synthase epsilon subunit [Candidatus Brocadia fulgida]
MAKTFKLEIITPEKVVYSDTVQSISAEGTEAPLVSLQTMRP